MAVGRPIKLTPNVASKTISIIATASLTVNLTTLGKILIARYMHVSNPINSNITSPMVG